MRVFPRVIILNQKRTFLPLFFLTILSLLLALNAKQVAAVEFGEVWEWKDGISNTKVSGLSNVAAIAIGDFHNLALLDDGTVWSWGRNGSGQLGTGNLNDSSVPVQVVAPSGDSYLNDVVAISAGSLHSVALKNDGTVWLWGIALGLNNNIYSISRPSQVMESDGVPIMDIKAIYAGSNHVLLLKNDGTVFEFGYNADHHLDNICSLGSECQYSAYPVQIKGPDGIGYLYST